jgi:hypothetical protein
MRGILECERVRRRTSYLEKHGEPRHPDELLGKKFSCLMLSRRAREHFWTLRTEAGPAKFEVNGPYDTDDGDVVTEWALGGAASSTSHVLNWSLICEPAGCASFCRIIRRSPSENRGALSSQEPAGSESPPLARFHGRPLPEDDPGGIGGVGSPPYTGLRPILKIRGRKKASGERRGLRR